MGKLAPVIVLLLALGAAVAFLVLKPLKPVEPPKPTDQTAPVGSASAFREYEIGEEVEREKEHLKVAAVWLPPVTMDHQMGGIAGPCTVHLECDIHALRGNEHGFGFGEWIPYLTIDYAITKEGDARPCLSGKLMPMVAKDGPHYGDTIDMPGLGKYKLVYKVHPPSENGFGRHTDPITGVSAWWEAFETSYDWDYKGVDKK
jgi:uncharacterized protein involved in high-affinity Fe2+ transport